MSKLKLGFKVLADVQNWLPTLEACDRLDADPSLSDADRVLVAQMRQALAQRASVVTLKRPGERPRPSKLKGKGPSASEQVIADRDITKESLADYEAGKTLTLDELWAKIGPKSWEDVSKTTEGMGSAPGDMEGVLAELERLRIEVEELRANRDYWMRLWQQVTTDLLRRTLRSTIQLPGANAETITLLNILDLGMEDFAAGRVDSLEEVGKHITGVPEAPDIDEIQAEVREVRRARAKRKGTL